MKSIQNSKVSKDPEWAIERALSLPIIDAGLHPSGLWTSKRYTKKLIAKAIKQLESDDSDNRC